VSEEYQRDCRYCGKPIRMINEGKGWKPCDSEDGTTAHDCEYLNKQWRKEREAEERKRRNELSEIRRRAYLNAHPEARGRAKMKQEAASYDKLFEEKLKHGDG